jgi:hypothetical protein
MDHKAKVARATSAKLPAHVVSIQGPHITAHERYSCFFS